MGKFRLFLSLIFAVLCSLSLGVLASPQESAQWVSSWYAAPDSSGPALKAGSVRQVLRSSVAGRKIRIQLSNRYGQQAVVIHRLSVAPHVGKGVIDLTRMKPLVFGGQSTVSLLPGREVWSDPIDFPLSALEELAISLYLPEGAASSSLHIFGLHTAYFKHGQDRTLEATMQADETDDSRYFVSALEVLSDSKALSIVALGDSVTDGDGSSLDQFQRWPDYLAQRLQANDDTRHISVINAGIVGNRLLNDGREPYLGESVLKRFERDVLQHKGVGWVMVNIGTNDITAAHYFDIPTERVTVEDMIRGLEHIAKLAHSRGIRAWISTVKPRMGAKFPSPQTPEAEAMRIKLNQWIRQQTVFDEMLDVDALLRDPKQPDTLLPHYDSGDHTHPNAAGYAAMAAMIDLKKLKLR